MEREEVREVSFDQLEKGHATQWEWMEDLFAWLDLRLYFYYKHHQWLGPDSDLRNMLGVVVSREEFEHKLAKSAQRGLEAMLEDEDGELLADSAGLIELRLSLSSPDFPLRLLFERCALDSFEQSCVILAFAAALDRKYEKLFAYLQDDITQKLPTVPLAVQLFLPFGERVEDYLTRFSREDAFTALFDPERLAAGSLALKQSVLGFLSTGAWPDSERIRLFDGQRQRPAGPMVIAQDVAEKLDRVFEQDGPWAVCLYGEPGIGRRFQVEHLMARKGARCVFADLEGEQAEALVKEANLAARLTDACLCCCHLDRKDADGNLLPPPGQLLNAILESEGSRDRVFLLSQLPIRAKIRRLNVDLRLPPTTEDERMALFRAFLGEHRLEEGLSAEELAAKFRFTPLQIQLACDQAKGLVRLDGSSVISAKLMHQCCYRQVVHKLGDLANPVRPAYGWDDVVLPESQKQLLQHACSHIK